MRDHNQKNFMSFLTGMLVAAGIGGYFLFFSKKAKRNRQKIDWWIEDAKDEIYRKAKKIKNISEDKFNDIVDTVMEKYSYLKDVSEEKMDKVKKEMRKKWEESKDEYDDYDDD